jgi:ribosomal protein S18 acetylase RimI-like enzyme
VHEGQTNVVPADVQLPPPPASTGRSGVVIRPGEATETDAAEIADVGGRVFTATFAHSCTEQDMAGFLKDNFTPQVILSELSNPAVHFLVAFSPEHGRIIGFSALRTDTADTEPCVADVKDRIELQRLYVDNALHGTGAGRQLMDGALDLAKQLGYKAVWLGVWEDNWRAKAFYEKFGFARVGEHIFELGVEKQTDYIFLKRF